MFTLIKTIITKIVSRITISDFRNCNSWHWEEKNALQWSRKYIQNELIQNTTNYNNKKYGIEVELHDENNNNDNDFKIVSLGITHLHSLEGDCFINMRRNNSINNNNNNNKSKVVPVYDLIVTFKWEAELRANNNNNDDNSNNNNNEEYSVEGEIIIKEFASANDEDEYEWEFKLTNNSNKNSSKGNNKKNSSTTTINNNVKENAKRMIQNTKEDILKVLRKFSEQLPFAFS